MISRPKHLAAVLAAAGLCTLAWLPGKCLAQGYGTKAKGMAGGAVALPQDAFATRFNPAGLAFVERRFDVSLADFNADRSYTVTGTPSGAPHTLGLLPGTVKSDHSTFLIPTTALNWPLDEKSAVGVMVYGNGGLNTTYPGTANGGAGTFYGGAAGVDIQQVFVVPTYARKVGPATALGISPVFATQRFHATGLGSLAPYVSDGVPNNLSDKGYDSSTGIGVRLGVQGDVHPRVTLAASYQTGISMSKFKKYSDLFAEHGGFDIPPTLVAGLAWKVAAPTTLTFEAEHTWNSQVHSVSNPFAHFLDGVATGNPGELLGGANGVGFGWRDVTTYKLGGQWQSSPRWAWRAGASYGRQPIPGSEALMNILAPSIQEWRFTAGFTRSLGAKSELNAALMYSPTKRVFGPNPLEVPGQQSIELRSRQFEIEASWARKF